MKYILNEDTNYTKRGDVGITIEDGVLLDVGMDVEKLIVPPGVHTIEANVCEDHEKLKQVAIPDTVKRIGASAFANDTNITHFALPLSVAAFGAVERFAFWGCCPEFIVTPLYLFDFFKRERVEEALFIADPEWTGITFVDFNNCQKLKKMYLPGNIADIDSRAFARCISLKEINYNNTKAAWSSIIKGPYWDVGEKDDKKLDFIVKCTDGVLTKETR